METPQFPLELLYLRFSNLPNFNFLGARMFLVGGLRRPQFLDTLNSELDGDTQIAKQ
jgi:hypothetical protein